MRLLDYWDIKTKFRKEKAFENGFIVEKSRDMHEYDWKVMARTMEAFENVT
ncbi:MAG: hypothetical protein AAB332_02635 [Planctomycetota bacterium]